MIFFSTNISVLFAYPKEECAEKWKFYRYAKSEFCFAKATVYLLTAQGAVAKWVFLSLMFAFKMEKPAIVVHCSCCRYCWFLKNAEKANIHICILRATDVFYQHNDIMASKDKGKK